MAFRNPQEKTINARALTDPQPRFVSLVQAGANQTPIKSVKVDIVSLEEKEMADKVTALKAEGHEVKKMVFKSGGKFDTKDAVQKFLDEGGYEGSIKETDDGFEVENEQDEFGEDVRKVEISDELTVFVGKLAAPEGDEADPEAAAKARANKSGSAITKVEVVETKGDDRVEENSADAWTGRNKGTKKAFTEVTGEGGDENHQRLAASIDGTMKPVRTRSRAKPDAEAEAEAAEAEGTEKADCGCGEGEGSTKQTEADCGPDEVFMDGKCVKSEVRVGDEVFQIMPEPLELDTQVTGLEMTIPSGSFEVTEKVELLSGDCGPGHTMISAGGRSFCVPTGDRSPVADNSEVSAPAAGGGQGSAGFGGTAPSEGQTQRTDKENTLRGDLEIGTETIAERFDEFSAHFSDGMTLAEVMEDANDGFPPGLESVILAAVMAMRNNFLVGDMAAVRQAGADLGEVAAVLGGLFETAERSEDRKKQIDALSGRFKELAFAEAETEGTDESATKDATTDDQGPLAEALAGFASTMKSIADSLGEVKEVVTKNTEATTDLTDRVKTLEETPRRQTRKGAEDGDVADGSTVQKKSPIADIRLRGALGITNSAAR